MIKAREVGDVVRVLAPQHQLISLADDGHHAVIAADWDGWEFAVRRADGPVFKGRVAACHDRESLVASVGAVLERIAKEITP